MDHRWCTKYMSSKTDDKKDRDKKRLELKQVLIKVLLDKRKKHGESSTGKTTV